MNVKTIGVTVDAAGAAALDVHITGQIVAVSVVLGTLDTPDVTITDLDTGSGILTAAAIAASKVFMPRRLVSLATDGTDLAATYDQPVVLGHAHIVVAGAGNKTSGTIRIAYRG